MEGLGCVRVRGSFMRVGDVSGGIEFVTGRGGGGLVSTGSIEFIAGPGGVLPRGTGECDEGMGKGLSLRLLAVLRTYSSG